MIKVITYGTYDLLHYGHIRLLERAKALGDYLIVGVTSDDYDKTRGKINNRQSFMERVAAVRATGIADEVIAEEYEGQKIDDIRRYSVDIFTVGSDWIGKFDYLNEYCKVVYLPRTEGVSSTSIRSKKLETRFGIIAEPGSEITSPFKFYSESKYVNGISIVNSNVDIEDLNVIDDREELLSDVDAVYIASHPSKHFDDIKGALTRGKHVLYESPMTLDFRQTTELINAAIENNCILMEGIKTAYTTAFERLVLMTKTGCIGKIVSVDAVCTCLKNLQNYSEENYEKNWNTITEWGPIALLPVFQILGTDYKNCHITTHLADEKTRFDDFTKVDFLFEHAVASIKVAKGAKSEGELIITGECGYIIVPSPWWKTDYYEIRYENSNDNKRYFYQLDGEGIRYEIVAFTKTMETGKSLSLIDRNFSIAVCRVMDQFYKGENVDYI